MTALLSRQFFRRLMRLVPGGMVFVLVCVLPAESTAQEFERPWSFSLVSASQVRGGLKNTFSDHWPANIGSIRAGKEIAGSDKGLSWEVEGQFVQHYGLQDHNELNGLVIARWNRFPLDRFINTSFAVGEGLSYATRVPEVEIARGQDSARLLNYLLFEFTFGLPAYPQWQLVSLMHHRSGAFGLFSGVSGGSNYFGFGVKHLFF
jgi:hypothetical protein